MRLINFYHPILHVELPSASLEIANAHMIVEKHFELGGIAYQLVGVVYFGEDKYYFASHVVDESERAFRYNGIINRGHVTYDGVIPEVPSTWMATMGPKVATVAIYAMVH
jgi:hypothetical protein